MVPIPPRYPSGILCLHEVSNISRKVGKLVISPDGILVGLNGGTIIILPVVEANAIEDVPPKEDIPLEKLLDDELPKEELLDDEPKKFRTVFTAFLIASITNSPLGSFHLTGLLTPNTYRFAACRVASGLSCMLCTPQNGSGCVNLPVLGLNERLRK